MAPITKKIKAIKMLSKFQMIDSDSCQSFDEPSNNVNNVNTVNNDQDKLYSCRLNCLRSYNQIDELVRNQSVCPQKEEHDEGGEKEDDNIEASFSSNDHYTESTSSSIISNQYSPRSSSCSFDSAPTHSLVRRKNGADLISKDSDEYRLRRERNNIAVRKSRSKSKFKFKETVDRLQQLEGENRHLTARVENLSQDLKYLKFVLFNRVCPNQGGSDTNYQLFEQHEPSIDLLINQMMNILKET